MSTYSYLKKGDKLPTVSILQLLLNRQRINKISVDGIFGPETKKAVVEYQKLRCIKVDGIVGRQTWPRITQGSGFRIVDCIDVTEDFIARTEKDKEYALYPFQKLGCRPVVVGAMSNGVEQAVNQILQHVGSSSNLILLRFHGHGNVGVQGISFGTRAFVDNQGNDVFIEADNRSSIESDNIKKITHILKRLHSIFGVYSSVQMHGCSVAGPRGSKGEKLLKELANIWEVPVSAGRWSQYDGNIVNTFKFEGPVFTAFPHGKNLKTWSAGLPQLAEMSIP